MGPLGALGAFGAWHFQNHMFFKFTASVRKKKALRRVSTVAPDSGAMECNGQFLECGLVSLLSSLSLLAAIQRRPNRVRICVVTFSVCKFKWGVCCRLFLGTGFANMCFTVDNRKGQGCSSMSGRLGLFVCFGLAPAPSARRAGKLLILVKRQAELLKA